MRSIALFFAVLLAAPAQAETPSPYAGKEKRSIAALSESDVAELQRGAGWGLARAAELNGVPGPAHLLELRDALGLSEMEVRRIEAIHARMKADAVSAGERFIAAERALNDAFKSGVPERARLEGLVREAGEARAALRLVHLAAHLQTPSLLTAHQIARYSVLRGYDDPCSTVPEGHDATMWRRHKGCE